MKISQMSDKELLERMEELTTKLKTGTKKAIIDTFRVVLKTREIEKESLRRKINKLSRKEYKKSDEWNFIKQITSSYRNKLTISPSEKEIRLKICEQSSAQIEKDLKIFVDKILPCFNLPGTGRGSFKWKEDHYYITLQFGKKGPAQHFVFYPSTYNFGILFSDKRS